MSMDTRCIVFSQGTIIASGPMKYDNKCDLIHKCTNHASNTMQYMTICKDTVSVGDLIPTI